LPKRSLELLTESMFYVLMAFRHGPMCGTDAAGYIEERTGGRLKIGPATLYTILARFEKEKYIQEVEVEGRKRTYRITRRGLEAYDAELERLRQCVLDAEQAQARREEDPYER
jgi:DNA-binding PadR family transcriptional regulator